MAAAEKPHQSRQTIITSNAQSMRTGLIGIIAAFGCVLCTLGVHAQQSDEQLREEIRKEVREELRREEIRKEEMERERQRVEREKQAEIDRLMAERVELRKREALENEGKEKADKQARISRRRDGWSISAHFGPNFPLGLMASNDVNKGHFGGTGLAVSLNNTIHFGNVMGVHIGLGYDKIALDEAGLTAAIRAQGNLPSDVQLRGRALPYEQYTVRVGPVIRALGRSVAFHFRPYIGINIFTGGNYSVDVLQNGNFLGNVALNRKSTGAFLVGTAWDLSFHIGTHSDIVVGMELNMSWRSVFTEVKATGQETRFDSENMELLRLAPMIGYRFHL